MTSTLALGISLMMASLQALADLTFRQARMTVAPCNAKDLAVSKPE
jgi:hypothetical protein